MVFTDRSLNHMSQRFVAVMQDIVDVLCMTYRAETVAVVPGGGTFAMEAVARQLATGRRCLVVRNGLFSYRWSQIFDAGSIPAETAGLPRPAGVRTSGAHRGYRLRSTRWWRPSSAAAPTSCSRHTSRLRPGWCCPTTISAPSLRRHTQSVGSSSSTASHRGRSGWT